MSTIVLDLLLLASCFKGCQFLTRFHPTVKNEDARRCKYELDKIMRCADGIPLASVVFGDVTSESAP